ncbi:hypothetical protein ARAM_004549 [Aspergillus rambellii]|uniref:Dynamin GTPase n=1 Tax=Aspergillus rambellii TaxID=308745 RepID=A0A0F8UYH3_9EURO|nr:hypothetical protein ARAM_004549 [Aspergillus rambellii]
MEAAPGPASADTINMIAQDMTALVKKIQDLRHLGIEDSHITLPKICVIGDQSTGKSSLIEGMSEIKVPRSAGTCTRCPMEINLTESENGQPWICRVYLSRKYMFDGSRKTTKLPKRSEPLGPWHEQDQEDEHFITISHKGDIEEAIKWAQMAILNPGRPTSEYIPGQNVGTDPQYCQVKFSPNIVRLDISAPTFPNLSFYDLPGVINQAEFDEERYLVSLVENLVKEYISQDNCIVLLTITMTDDVMNSSAARIMRDVRGAKGRTLGVLTKPDRVPHGESYAQWIEILEGDKFSLGHGYYVVRNNPDPSVEHSQAREEEDSFFASHPWITELAVYQDRFGTRHLQSALSSLLYQQIQGCLPKIIEQINGKAARIDAELETLPDPPSANVPYILCGKLHMLKDQIRCHIDGGSREYPMQKIWGQIASDFKRALVKSRPTVRLLADSDKKLPVENGDDSDCEVTTQRSVKRKLSADQPSGVVPDARNKQSPASSGYYTHHFDKFDRPIKTFSWEEIRDIRLDSYSAGIPGQTNPKSIETMNRMSVEHWKDPMLKFIYATHRLVKETLLTEVERTFLQYHQTGLYRELKRIIENYTQRLRADHIAHADEIFDIEHHKPFTMASTALELATQAAYKYLDGRRAEARAACLFDLQHKPAAGDPRREAEIKKIVADLGADNFSQEVRMMASTRGYYDVASSRFVDSICQSVHTKLFLKCREGLITEIETVDRCNELMAEDPERQRRRQYLLKEKEKINKAQAWLETAKMDVEQDERLTDFGREIKSQQPEEWGLRSPAMTGY